MPHRVWSVSSPEAVAAWSGSPCRIAQTHEQVYAAWQLVYEVYRNKGLIPANPFEIHAPTQMLSSHSAVMVKLAGSEVASTMSAVADGPAGLPLDEVYQLELDELRSRGRRLVEVGLFADRVNLQRNPAVASSEQSEIRSSLIDLFNATFHYARHVGATDLVIGVHPRHAAFYRRYCGFVPWGEQKLYATVNYRPVVLMRLDWEIVLQWKPAPSWLVHCAGQPLPEGAFEHRLRWPERITRPLWAYAYLLDREQPLVAAG